MFNTYKLHVKALIHGCNIVIDREIEKSKVLIQSLLNFGDPVSSFSFFMLVGFAVILRQIHRIASFIGMYFLQKWFAFRSEVLSYSSVEKTFAFVLQNRIDHEVYDFGVFCRHFSHCIMFISVWTENYLDFSNNFRFLGQRLFLHNLTERMNLYWKHAFEYFVYSVQNSHFVTSSKPRM